MPPCVFLHVPKTGGTSLKSMFQSALGHSAIYPESHEGDLARAATIGTKYRLYFGHYDYDEIQHIGRVRIASMLRDPVERAVSLYRYWSSFALDSFEARSDVGVAFASSVSVMEFFQRASPEIKRNFSNAMTRQLVGESLCSPGGGFRLSESNAIALALERIEQMSACGVMEDFNRATARIFRAFEVAKRPCEIKVNTLEERMGDPKARHIDRFAISRELRELVEHLNVLDRTLYEHIREASATS